jgi:hypothetical protein
MNPRSGWAQGGLVRLQSAFKDPRDDTLSLCPS